MSTHAPILSGWHRKFGGRGLDALAGSAVALLGATTMLGWLLRLPGLTEIQHGLVPMVFNAGLCFFLTGSALLLPLRGSGPALLARTRIASVLIGLCGLTLIEIVLDRSLAGVDLAFLHEWYEYGNKRPGRMAPNTAIGFIAIGCSILAADRVRSRTTALTAIGLTFVVLAIGLTGLMGYLLAPDLLFDWARSARMALHTASGMILTALGLCLAWSRSPWYADEAYLPQEAKVRVLSGAILILATVMASLTGFVLQQQSVESALQHRLTDIVRTRGAWLKLLLDQSDLHAREIAQLLGGHAQPRQGTAVDSSATLRNRFAQQAEPLLQGWQRIALEDGAGTPLVTVGKKRGAPAEFEASLDAKGDAALIWDEQLVLRLRLPLSSGNASTGTDLVLERAIPDVAAALFGTAGMGATGEVLVCIKRDDHMLCLPNRSQALPFKLAPVSPGTPPLPMQRALANEFGVEQSIDYRGRNVLAAYGQLAPGLGFVVKQDTQELYAGIRRALLYGAPLIVLLVLTGVGLMAWQVSPLVARMRQAEESASIAGVKTQAIVAELITAQNVAKMGSWSTELVGGKVGEWSLGAHRVFGTDPELFEPTYEAFLNRVHPDDRAAVDQAFMRSHRQQGARVSEFRIVMPTGEVKVVEERWQVFLDPQGVPVRAFGTTQDVTERRRNQDALRELNADLELRVKERTAELTAAREEAEHANQAKSDFLAAISHELRTPMSGLLGLLELLGLDKLKKEQHETLAVARESGNALLHIIDDLLDFAKIEAHRLELDPEAASVAEVVERTCLLHSRIASSKDLTLACEVDPQISPVLSFDALRLGQILNNFLNNAIKFTEHGRVDVRVDMVARAPGSEELRFTVRDTGIGITPEQLGRLFQPFVQAGRATSTHFGGTGLGLVISRRLAQLMGGAVDIQSEPGRGTTLTLTVAFAVCTEVPEAGDTDRHALDALLAGRRPAPAVHQAERDGTLLLLVDDHPTNRLLLLRQVASLGYAGEAADDGKQALAAWKSGRFAAIITDCNMPRMNGYELTEAIRRSEEQTGARRIPIIGCTANAVRKAAEQCLSAGMDDWLIKPAGLAEISQKLDLWVPLARFEHMATVPARLPRPKSSPEAPGNVNPGPIDLVLLEEISGRNPQVQRELLADFQRVNEQDAVALRQAVEVDDFKGVSQLAHRIKGANLMLGAVRMAAACEELEAAAAGAQSGAIKAAMMQFESELLGLNRFFGERLRDCND